MGPSAVCFIRHKDKVRAKQSFSRHDANSATKRDNGDERETVVWGNPLRRKATRLTLHNTHQREATIFLIFTIVRSTCCRCGYMA